MIYSQEPKANRPHSEPLLLCREGWTLQSSGKVDEKGEVLSSPAFQPKDWYTVSVPTTVVAALVERKVYPDPVFGTNLRSFPGRHLSDRREFFQHPHAAGQSFIVPWWYRKEFVAARRLQGKDHLAEFRRDQYRANIWLNGNRSPSPTMLPAPGEPTSSTSPTRAMLGKTNVLAVQVFSPTDTDLAITFVDWNPAPPG